MPCLRRYCFLVHSWQAAEGENQRQGPHIFSQCKQGEAEIAEIAEARTEIVLYCIVLYCIVLYCIVLYCIVLYCIVLYLFCIVWYRIVLYGIVLRLPGFR